MSERQMTFSTVLGDDRKPQMLIPVNPSVKADDKPRLSRQAYAIYERLQSGPATTSELAYIGLQYCARINEIRHFLVKDGKMIDVLEGENGENLYEIVPLERSTFWRRVKEKQEQWKWIH